MNTARRPVNTVSRPMYRSLIGRSLGNYIIKGVLGKGSFGIVYFAMHSLLGTPTAIKIPYAKTPTNRQEQFYEEARLAASLNHRHIARVLDYGKEGRLPYLVVEYAPNGNLRQQYPYGTILPLKKVVYYTNQVADALDYIHEQGLIHQDIKPDNMLLDHNNDILLSDFSIAVTVRDAATLMDKQSVGTVAYMAPEQIQGHSCFASDQYALAIVVYEWLCGQRPFQGSSYEVAQDHLFASPPSLRQLVPSIPAKVEQVVLRALAKKPEDRFATVQEFAQNLEEAYRTIYSDQSSSRVYIRSAQRRSQPKMVLKERKHMLLPDNQFFERGNRENQFFKRRKRGNKWKEATLLFTADIVIGIPIFIILHLLGIQVWTIWFFISLCYVALPPLVALYLKRTGILLYLCALLAVSAAIGIGFHSQVLFMTFYTLGLFVGFYVAFTLSIRDD